jgi:two-component system response regulator AlgR
VSHPQALRVVVCDDEAPARSRMRELLEDCAATLPLELVGEAANGVELLALLQEREADLVLMDIRMPGMDGLEAAGHLAKLDDPPKVIFATAFDAHAVKAFELHAVDYLLKPIRLRRLFDALTRARALTPLRLDMLREMAPEPRTHLSVPERGRVVLVPVPEILFLRAELKYVTIRTATREHLLEESLTRLEQEFAASFIRIHRSYLVAKRHLAGFERAGEGAEGGWVAVVKGLDERLPVSRRQAHVVREFGRTLL